MTKKKQKKQQAGLQFPSPEQYMKQCVRSLEIGKCNITEVIEECGEGHFNAPFYLVDMLCLGAKDSFYHLTLAEEEMDKFLDNGQVLRECSYEEAHNWIYGAISWEEEAGIEPYKSFAITQYILEEVTDDIPLTMRPFTWWTCFVLARKTLFIISRLLRKKWTSSLICHCLRRTLALGTKHSPSKPTTLTLILILKR